MAVAAGETVIEVLAAPLLQRYDDPPEALMVAVAPLQIIPSSFSSPDISDVSNTGTGSGLTVMVTDVTAEQPAALVTVTE